MGGGEKRERARKEGGERERHLRPRAACVHVVACITSKIIDGNKKKR